MLALRSEGHVEDGGEEDEARRRLGCLGGCAPLRPVAQAVVWKKKFPEADPLAIDLMTKMMAFDPRKRITVTEALSHPWLAQLHDEASEPSAPSECERRGGAGRKRVWARGRPHQAGAQRWGGAARSAAIPRIVRVDSGCCQEGRSGAFWGGRVARATPPCRCLERCLGRASWCTRVRRPV